MRISSQERICFWEHELSHLQGQSSTQNCLRLMTLNCSTINVQCALSHDIRSPWDAEPRNLCRGAACTYIVWRTRPFRYIMRHMQVRFEGPVHRQYNSVSHRTCIKPDPANNAYTGVCALLSPRDVLGLNSTGTTAYAEASVCRAVSIGAHQCSVHDELCVPAVAPTREPFVREAAACVWDTL
jgi:hypothetical protein